MCIRDRPNTPGYPPLHPPDSPGNNRSGPGVLTGPREWTPLNSDEVVAFRPPHFGRRPRYRFRRRGLNYVPMMPLWYGMMKICWLVMVSAAILAAASPADASTSAWGTGNLPLSEAGTTAAAHSQGSGGIMPAAVSYPVAAHPGPPHSTLTAADMTACGSEVAPPAPPVPPPASGP